MSADEDARSERRREQLAAIHQQLTDAVDQLATSDAWLHMLQVAARLPSYSLNNTLLVAVQRPDATAVAGYRAWAAVGRQVRRGEKGIAILAPCLYKAEESDGAEPGDAARVLRGFRVVHVFDISQTDGPPVPEAPQLLRGEAPDGLWEQLATLVAQDGFELQRGDCGGPNGYTDYQRRVVRVRDDVDDAQAVKTLAHELGHIRADHEHRYLGAPASSRRCRGLAEVEAESIAFIVLASSGADASSFSAPYVAGWSGGNSEMLTATAERVTSCASGILGATGRRDRAGVAVEVDSVSRRASNRSAALGL